MGKLAGLLRRYRAVPVKAKGVRVSFCLWGTKYITWSRSGYTGAWTSAEKMLNPTNMVQVRCGKAFLRFYSLLWVEIFPKMNVMVFTLLRPDCIMEGK